MFVYVGTYSNRGGKSSEGLYAGRLDLATGAMSLCGSRGDVQNPTFLAIDPLRHRLYSAGQMDAPAAGAGGVVAAYTVAPETGELQLLNRETVDGSGPCHVTIDAAAHIVIATGYHSGSLTVLPLRADGRIGPRTQCIRYTGSSVNPTRQREPHPHSANFAPGDRFLFVPDLGTDRVANYVVQAAAGHLIANPAQPFMPVKPGAGPRHFTFHPNGRTAYLINELDSTINVYAFEPARGVLTELQSVPALPPEYCGVSTCAEVQVTPSGRFVYGSNRGHDSLAVFAVGEDGRLSPRGHVPSGGREPRHFGIDPTGAFLVAANQNTHNLTSFRIDPATGALTSTGHTLEIPSPVCVTFLARS